MHDMKHFKAESFCNDIYYSLKSLQCNSDPDLTMKNLFNKIVNVAAGHAPLRKLSKKESKSKPWITKRTLKSIKTFNVLNKKKSIFDIRIQSIQK